MADAEVLVVGVDPGVDGGVAVLWSGGSVVEVHPMPVVEVAKGRRELDLEAVKRVAGYGRVVFIEKQQAYPKQGCVSSFRCGDGYGGLRGLFVGMGRPAQLVAPKVWQAAFGLARGDKGRSILAAQGLFPGVDLRASTRCRTLHDGMAEALLIAEWGRRQMVGESCGR